MGNPNQSGPAEEEVEGLLAAPPPVPRGWTEAEQELPRLRQSPDGLVARAEKDDAFRREVLADIDAALTEVGVEPQQAAIASLRARLT